MGRVVLVISHLGLGGAERVMRDLADTWSALGVHVTLVTLNQGTKPDFYTTAPEVARVDLDFGERRRRAWPKMRTLACLWALRRTIACARPDVVVSFITSTNLFTLAATAGSRVPVIVSERIDPRVEPIDAPGARLRKWLYPRAAAIVVQTSSAATFFTGRSRQNVHVIGNAVAAAPTASERAASDRRLVLAMGRLATQKRFDLLLHAFARLADQFADWDLEIWGEGPERLALTRLIDALGLRSRASLQGRTDRPYDQYYRADLFVLSSDYEGFPNALAEAMSCGVACISTDCPSGPSEIVRNGVDGFLVPVGDAAQLASTMRRLMANSDERLRVGEAARELPRRLSSERVFSAWNDLTQSVTSASVR